MRLLLVEALGREGFRVDALGAAKPALAALGHTAYDLAIIDIGLPGMSGLDLIRQLRQRGVLTPVLILTARDALDDRVVGLDIGGDDYLTKPFLLQELMARIRALIRRSRAAASLTLSVGALELDAQRHEARMSGERLELTGREWSILEQLVLGMPRVVAKAKLADSLSQWDKEITPNAVEVYVSRLRGKLQGSGLSIRTVRGIGYRIELEAADAAPAS